MVDQAQPASPGSEHPDASFVEGNAGGEGRFPPRGQPVIRGINGIGLWSLYIKEIRRFLKVQTQTIWAPAVTTLLFLVIFSVALGRGGREVLGVNFPTFVAPGLIAMAMMQNGFANSSFSLLSGKIQGTIIDLLMPPLSHGELLAGIVGAAVTRGVLVGGAVALAIFLYPDAKLMVAHPWAIVWFGLMGALMLGFFGLMASIWAEKFDHAAAVTNFVIAPLSLLSGTFYSVEALPKGLYQITHLNPVFYLIDGARWGVIGVSDTAPALGFAIALAATILACLAAWLLFRRGTRLKS